MLSMLGCSGCESPLAAKEAMQKCLGVLGEEVLTEIDSCLTEGNIQVPANFSQVVHICLFSRLLEIPCFILSASLDVAGLESRAVVEMNQKRIVMKRSAMKRNQKSRAVEKDQRQRSWITSAVARGQIEQARRHASKNWEVKTSTTMATATVDAHAARNKSAGGCKSRREPENSSLTRCPNPG